MKITGVSCHMVTIPYKYSAPPLAGHDEAAQTVIASHLFRSKLHTGP
jgi:hypothetical protein